MGGIILMTLLLLVGGYVIGFFWLLTFWISSFLWYLIAWFLSLFGIYMKVSGDSMVWLLFLVVCGISYYLYIANFSDCGLFLAIFSFLSGNFMLFRSADMWKVAE